MLKLKFISSKRRLDLPIYSLTEKKSRVKSTFIDHNRVDTVRPVPCDLTVDEFIMSGYFHKMIFEDCYEASKRDNMVVSLSGEFAKSDEIESYLRRFFVDNKLGVIIGKYTGYCSFYIEIKLNKNITFEDIGNAYISELERVNLSKEDIKSKKLTLKKKINNEGN